MSEKFVTSLRIDKKLWKEAKKHAIEKDTTIGKLMENLIKKEIKKQL
jgi:predicted DNA-binding ribbon-helix-helix protein